jgi:hypothetical protein
MFFKIISRDNYQQYQQLLDENEVFNRERQQHNQLESDYRILERQKNELEQKYHSETAELRAQLDVLKEKTQDYEALHAEHEKLKETMGEHITDEIERAIDELGFNREQIEKLWLDRADLVELYTEKLYSLARHFAVASKEMRKNRGLFLLLIDRRNMLEENFSEFYDGQTEHLTEPQYQGIDLLPHLFAPKIDEVLNYMGEKIALKDETGEITGYEERDGALLIDLRGCAVRSRIMVEGVRTYRVYDGVEALQKGSAKHNAAIYASSLEEVMVAIVISGENSEVTLFRNGRFIKSYNPYTDTEILRETELVGTAPDEQFPPANVELVEDTADIEDDQEATIIEDEHTQTIVQDVDNTDTMPPTTPPVD